MNEKSENVTKVPERLDLLSQGIIGHPELILIAVVNDRGAIIPVESAHETTEDQKSTQRPIQEGSK